MKDVSKNRQLYIANAGLALNARNKNEKNKMNQNFCRRTRREFLWQAGGGFTGLALAGLLDRNFLAAQDKRADGKKWVNPLAAKALHFAPKAKSVIFLSLIHI